MHQITAYGGNAGPVPFQQAIPQSPGWFPISSNYEQEQVFNRFLQLTNTTSIEEARQLSSAALIAANRIQVSEASYGQFVYGPVVDNDFVPGQPGKLLLQGSFDKSVNVMVGFNANEGLLFTSPFVTSNDAFRVAITAALPSATPAVIDYISNVLYPPVFDGTYPYRNNIERFAFLNSESIFTCNTFYLDTAYDNQTHAYLFSVPPALHGQDVPYTFYNGNTTTGIRNATVALALQQYITSFAEIGRPVGENGIPYFPLYGSNATVQNLNITRISQVMDPNANQRCVWWQKALYN